MKVEGVERSKKHKINIPQIEFKFESERIFITIIIQKFISSVIK